MAFDPIVNGEIGQRLRAMRERRGFSREALAEQADISVQFLADIEMGRKGMTVQTIRKLVLALNCNSDDLLFGSAEGSRCAQAVLVTKILSLTPAQTDLANSVLDLVLQALPGDT